jgi:hypothetical protein
MIFASSSPLKSGWSIVLHLHDRRFETDVAREMP